MFSWHLPSPDSPTRLPNRESLFVTPQDTFPLLQWQRATPLLTLGIVLDDTRTACSCSAIKTPSMRLSLHSFCACINACGCLELFSFGISRALSTFTHHAAQHSMTLLYDFTWHFALCCCCF